MGGTVACLASNTAFPCARPVKLGELIVPHVKCIGMGTRFSEIHVACKAVGLLEPRFTRVCGL